MPTRACRQLVAVVVLVAVGLVGAAVPAQAAGPSRGSGRTVVVPASGEPVVVTGNGGVWHAGTVARRVEHIVRTVVEESVDAVAVTVRSWCDAVSSWWEDTAPRWVQRVVAQGRAVRELRETVQEVRGTVREVLHLDVALG